MDSKKSKEGVRTPVILSKSKEQNFLKNCEKSMTNSIVWDLEKIGKWKVTLFWSLWKKLVKSQCYVVTNGHWYLLSMLPIPIGNHVALRFDEFFHGIFKTPKNQRKFDSSSLSIAIWRVFFMNFITKVSLFISRFFSKSHTMELVMVFGYF